jgi:hypothetical protein
MGEESPNRVNGPPGAVFLSYASQDQEAAQRIARPCALWASREDLRQSIMDRGCAAHIRRTHTRHPHRRFDT